MTKEQLLVEIEDLLRTTPPRPTIRHATEENLNWFGRASAVVEQWNPDRNRLMADYVERIHGVAASDAVVALNGMFTLLHQAKHDLRMQTLGPLNLALQHGMVFDYFDEIRKVIELSQQELFFIDPYLDAEFVSRYLPHATPGVAVRLLAREKLQTLLPAVDAFVQQAKAKVQIRSAPNFHDRYLIVDRTTCYQSGASFKDGAKSAPTTLTQITDAFPAVLATYEGLWSGARVER
ncbi:MAG: hypothetical protein WBQ09_09455 [Terriglobales bacterium]